MNRQRSKRTGFAKWMQSAMPQGRLWIRGWFLKKYNYSKLEQKRVYDVSDRLCREYVLSIIERRKKELSRMLYFVKRAESRHVIIFIFRTWKKQLIGTERWKRCKNLWCVRNMKWILWAGIRGWNYCNKRGKENQYNRMYRREETRGWKRGKKVWLVRKLQSRDIGAFLWLI